MDNEKLSELNDAIKKPYQRLVNGLEKICGIPGWTALYKLEMSSYIEEQSLDTLDLMWDSKIHPYNITDDNKFRCCCGKRHIKRLTFMTLPEKPNEMLIIGSDCIHTIADFCDELQEIFGTDFKNKVNEWVEYIERERKKYTHKKCISCGELKIRQGYNYKKQERKYYCKDCVYLNNVKCQKCGDYRPFKLQYKNGPPMPLCGHCYSTRMLPSLPAV
jgi:hypothetical protein